MDKQEIGKVLKHKLDQLQESPEEFVWENIESKLSRKKTNTRWYLLLLILLSIGLFYLLKPSPVHTSTKINEEYLISPDAQYKITGINKKKEKKEKKTSKHLVKTLLIKENNITHPKTTLKQAISLSPKNYHKLNITNIFPKLNLNTLETPKKNIYEKWEITATAGINFLNTSVTENHIKNIGKRNKNNSTSETYGIYFNYIINKRLKIRTGLKRLKINFNTYHVPNEQSINNLLNANTVNIQGNLYFSDLKLLFQDAHFIHISERNNYLEIPLETKYVFLKKVPNFSIISGFSILLLEKNGIYAYSSNSKRLLLGTSKMIKSRNFTFNLGAEYIFDVSKNLQFSVECNYKQFFNLYHSNNINFNSNTLNFQTGITYSF
ncbi:PorT family protein [Tenacibaculum aiptasiae]|uniref:PorT family protein n=1 Tax=Tenacibaculum aiptasiae TaxID=426481 RepID=A0A7J5AIJ9_9FLAO|nr:PorT family protein [Tenacibaculum aiptasiae]KAB1157345.1 PorT family protein [Tenacibaculum aiptasiae]